MLILKRKFPKANLRLSWLAAWVPLLLCATLGVPATGDAYAAPARAAAAPAAPLRAPDSVAAEFYGWYLEVLSADQDPLSDRYERFSSYVTQDLTRRLIDRLPTRPLSQSGASAGAASDVQASSQSASQSDLQSDLQSDSQSDYFLQAPTFQPAWRQGVGTLLLRRERDTAQVLVTLSAPGTATQSLVLIMVPENGAWKIRRVVQVERRALESSPEQFGI